MNLYLISWPELDKDGNYEDHGYDVYDAAVVAADSPERARYLHPAGHGKTWDFDAQCWYTPRDDGAKSFDRHNDYWTTPDKVKVKLIGLSTIGVEGVVLASFNAA